MRKLPYIISILIFLTTLCLVEEILIKKTLKTTYENSVYLYDLTYNLQDINTEEIINLSQELEQYWNKNEILLCFFVNHKDMHELGNELVKMVSYSKNNVKEDFLASLELVIYYSSTFKHLMGVSLQNVF